MTNPQDIISSIRDLSPELSKSERQLAETILADVDFAIHATTGEIAKKSGVSSPTLTRFCRSLGLNGLRELKVQLAQSLSVGSRYLTQDIKPDNINEVAANVIGSAQRALHTLHANMDYASLALAVDKIVRGDKVVIFGGGGGSSIVAQDAEYRLFRLSTHAVSYNDSQLQIMVAATLKERDVLIAISTSGRNYEMRESALIAQQYNTQVIAITRPGSPLANIADIVIPVDIPESSDIYKPTESRYALLAAVDILANEVALQKGTQATENLRRIKHQLVSARDEDDSQPLGD